MSAELGVRTRMSADASAAARCEQESEKSCGRRFGPKNWKERRSFGIGARMRVAAVHRPIGRRKLMHAGGATMRMRNRVRRRDSMTKMEWTPRVDVGARMATGAVRRHVST